MLTDNEICAAIKRGEIIIKPFVEDNLGTNSYDLRIGDRIRSMKYNFGIINLTQPFQYNFMDMNLPYLINPKELILFTSKEVVGCKEKTIGLLSPRSNLSRSGLMFQFSQLLDTGFKGIISGMIYNPTNSSFVLPKDLRIMQIMFEENTGLLRKKYNERWLSKNTDQFKIEDIQYKPDKELK